VKTTPLFIPLMARFYDAFANGRKTTEYRLYGPRWNRVTCFPGRRVRLSYGYGLSRPRLTGAVVRTTRVRNTVTSIYPKGAWLAAIRIKLGGPE
jgi:hypothetical protein